MAADPEEIAEDARGALSQSDALRLLKDAPLLRLGYDGIDGTPRVIPIGFLWTGSAIVVCTATSAPKTAALTRRPHVAVSIDEGATPADARALLIRGAATLETVEGVPDEYLAGAAKVMDPEQVPAFAQACALMYPQMVRITITPTWARFFDFGGGRLPAFLGRMAQEAEQR